MQSYLVIVSDKWRTVQPPSSGYKSKVNMKENGSDYRDGQEEYHTIMFDPCYEN
jgi:hypothetical protein